MTCTTDPIIYVGYDKQVTLSFVFDGDFDTAGGLQAFNRVEVIVGSESYNSVDNPQAIVIVDKYKLRISIGDVTALPTGSYHPRVIGFNSTYNDGYPLLVRGMGGSSIVERLRIESI